MNELLKIKDVQFYSEPVSVDSRRLLEVAYDYLTSLNDDRMLSVCITSSTAWGTATPVSDVDLQIIIPEDTAVRREKIEYQDTYIDRVDFTKREFGTYLRGLIANPLSNPLGSYSLAYSVVIKDWDEQLSKAQSELHRLLSHPEEKQKWIAHYLRYARELATKLDEAGSENMADHLASCTFESVRRYMDALLHNARGGHCGQWPHRMQQYANKKRISWPVELAKRIIFPHGLDLAMLSKVVLPLEHLHLDSAKPPRGHGIGNSTPNAGYFAKKARYYVELGDGLSLLATLRRQIGYVEENVEEKQMSSGDSLQVIRQAQELDKIKKEIRMAWPWNQADRKIALAGLAELSQQVVTHLEAENML